MHPTGGQPQHNVAACHVGAIENLRFFNGADGEPGQVVFARRVHAGHFSRFPTDQGTAGQLAASGDATHNCHSGFHFKFAAGKVIKEEERFGTLNQDIVHAHGHKVNAHRVMHVPFKRQFELGADAIRATDEHWLAVALGNLEKCAKTANARQNAFAHGFSCQGLDAFDQCIASVDVHAGIFVA